MGLPVRAWGRRSAGVSLTNRVLDTMNPDTRARLQPHLRLVHLTHGQVLADVGESRRSIWFPTTSVLSVLGLATSGDVVELATIGPTTCADVWAMLDAEASLHRVIVRGAGGAYRLPVDIGRREFHANDRFQYL